MPLQYDVTIRRVGEAVDQLGDDLGTVYSIGLTEDTEPGDDSFALIFSITEPDDDRQGYCVVVEPGQRTAYRSVTECRLDARSLYVSFTEADADQLGLPTAIDLDLAVTVDELTMLRRGLARVGLLDA